MNERFVVLVLVFVVYNRRREAHIKYPGPDDDVRENIINYDDEGGGEDDMTAFDITPLQIPIGGPLPELAPPKLGCTHLQLYCTTSSNMFFGCSLNVGGGPGTERGGVHRGAQKACRQRPERPAIRRSQELRLRRGRQHRRLPQLVGFR